MSHFISSLLTQHRFPGFQGNRARKLTQGHIYSQRNQKDFVNPLLYSCMPIQVPVESLRDLQLHCQIFKSCYKPNVKQRLLLQRQNCITSIGWTCHTLSLCGINCFLVSQVFESIIPQTHFQFMPQTKFMLQMKFLVHALNYVNRNCAFSSTVFYQGS